MTVVILTCVVLGVKERRSGPSLNTYRHFNSKVIRRSCDQSARQIESARAAYVRTVAVLMAAIRGFSLAKISKVRVAFNTFDSRVASAR